MAYLRCAQCAGFYDEEEEFCPRCHHPTRISNVFETERAEDEFEASRKGYVIDCGWKW